ncbi:MAG: hypothetical protein ABSG15_03305 [FCB group bacterium]
MEKNFRFTDADIKKMSDRFKILSEPSRLKILRACNRNYRKDRTVTGKRFQTTKNNGKEQCCLL